MFSFKKVLVAVFCGQSVAYAGMMGSICDGVNVTIPCETRAWELGGHALYVQSKAGGNVANRSIITSVNTFNQGHDAIWDWGYQLEATYFYRNGKDIHLNWYHYRNSDNNALGSPVNLGTVVTNADFPSSQPTTYTDVIVDSTTQYMAPQWDQVNIEFGRRMDMGPDNYARFHAGFNYSRAAVNSSTTLSGSYVSDSPVSYSKSDNTSAVYNGFGARLGMLLNYDIGWGLSLYGDGAGSVLAGTSKTNYSISNNATTQSWTIYNYSSTRVVPELDAKLGLQYAYINSHGQLTADVGWLWASYINALASEGKSSGVQLNSFGVQGVFFGFKWLGHLA